MPFRRHFLVALSLEFKHTSHPVLVHITANQAPCLKACLSRRRIQTLFVYTCHGGLLFDGKGRFRDLGCCTGSCAIPDVLERKEERQHLCLDICWHTNRTDDSKANDWNVTQRTSLTCLASF